MKCIECGHDTINKNRTYVANLENCVIIIKNVPAMVCEHCNEVYYSDEVFGQIEKIVYKLENIINDIAVIDYTNSAHVKNSPACWSRQRKKNKVHLYTYVTLPTECVS